MSTALINSAQTLTWSNLLIITPSKGCLARLASFGSPAKRRGSGGNRRPQPRQCKWWRHIIFDLSFPAPYDPPVASEVAVIVPVYNEEENVLPMAREVSEALKKAGRSYELVFVDDASTDGTWKKIEDARQHFPHVRGLRHAVN